MGDRFFVVMKGESSVLIGTTKAVPGYSKTISDQVENYLKCILENHATVHWSKVPYRAQVKALIDSNLNIVNALQNKIASVFDSKSIRRDSILIKDPK